MQKTECVETRKDEDKILNGKYKLLLKDTLIFAVGSLGSKLILFFLVPLYTNYMSTAEYGTADLVGSFSQLVIPFSALVINEAVIRFGLKTSERKENVLLSSFFVLTFSVFVAGLICFGLSFYKPLSEWWMYLYIHVIFANIAEVEKAYLKVKNRNRTLAIISIGHTAVLAISNIILLTVYRTGVRGYLISNILSSAFTVTSIFFAAGIYRDIKNSSFEVRLMKQMVIYSAPLVFSNISWWVIHSSDKIMIESMINASALGIYTAATKIPSLINVIIAIFNQAWGLSTIREVESGNDRRFFGDVFSKFSTLLFAAAIFFTCLIKPFMHVYVGKEFTNAWQYTPLLLSAAVFYSISAFIGSLYAALEKSVNNMWTTILCAIINVVVNYIFISRVGVWGAIVGTITAYFIIAVLRIADVKKYVSIVSNLRQLVGNIILMIIHAILVSMNLHILVVSTVTIVLFVLNNTCFFRDAYAHGKKLLLYLIKKK